jgi:SAM-dependent methyltransferase
MSLLAPIRRHRVDQATRSGLLRSVRLFRLFMAEQTDPERFYASLAEDAVQQVAEHCELGGQTVVDIGGGGGWFTAAFQARGAHSYLFEPDPTELHSRADSVPAGAVVADGYWLPVRDGGADVVFSSNVLEHVPDPMGLIEEMIRATRPGGLRTGSTNRYSPWAGTRCRRGTTWARIADALRRTGASPSTTAASTCSRCTSGRCRGRCGPAGRQDRGGAAPLLPALVPAGSGCRSAGGRHLNLMLIMRRIE